MSSAFSSSCLKIHSLKGKCHEIPCFAVFKLIIFPQACDINIASFQFSHGDIRQARGTTAANDTGGNFDPSVVDIGDKFIAGVNRS
jgi:hypothetical protein